MPAKVAGAAIVFVPASPALGDFSPGTNVFGNNIASISRSVPNCSDGIFDLDHDPTGRGPPGVEVHDERVHPTPKR